MCTWSAGATPLPLSSVQVDRKQVPADWSRKLQAIQTKAAEVCDSAIVGAYIFAYVMVLVTYGMASSCRPSKPKQPRCVAAPAPAADGA